MSTFNRRPRQPGDTSAAQVASASTTDRVTFYICGGAWHGAWAYEPVADVLEQLGFPVHSPANAGQGMLESPLGVTREIVVARHLRHILVHNLHDLTVVGWSYGG